MPLCVEQTPRGGLRGPTPFLLLTQPFSDALSGIGWSLDSDQQHRDSAVLCRLSGRLDRTLLLALIVSVPSTPDASLTSVSVSQRNACSPWSNGL